MSRLRIAFCFLLGTVVVSGCLPALAQMHEDHWVGTWATAPYAEKNTKNTYSAETSANGVTLRQVVHVSLGGSSVRVTLTNAFGTSDLKIGAAEIALRDKDSAVVAESEVPLTFNGHSEVVIPAGALVVSDAATLSVKPMSDLAVSLFVPAQQVEVISYHSFAAETNYSAEGNVVTATELTGAKTFFSYDFLTGVDVQAGDAAAAVVCFGDSITDGAKSTRDKNARWPDFLAARLLADKKTAHIGVLNEGIGGNRVLHDGTGPNALARFDRDVLAQAGVRYLILMESINDIGHATDPKKPYDIVSADDLIAGLAQMARRAHTHGIKVFGATLTPFVGAGYQSADGEVMRQKVNAWIRTSKELDGVVDFDKATTDPANPGVFLPSADSGDHLHPGDAGYKAMGDAIDLKLFTK